MTTLQKKGEQSLTPDSLVPITLKSADRWDHVAPFIGLTMCRKMEMAWGWQRQSIVAAIQHLMPNLAIPAPPLFATSNSAMEEENDPGWSTSEIYGSH